MKRMILMAGMLLCGTVAMQAQAGATPTLAEPSQVFNGMLNEFEADVMGVAKAMPADQYGFAPSQSLFAAGHAVKFDGVRTFAEQAVHIAQANYLIYHGVGGAKPPVDVKALSNLKSKDEIVAALAASFTYAHQSVATLTPANAFEIVKGPGLQTRASLAALGVAHGSDHFGQMVEYLRMNGLTPPGSK